MNILVVDDEKAQRGILTDILEDAGYAVGTAADGEIALDMLISEDYQIVLTDLKMPGMDGVQLLSSVLEVKPDIQVIIMTAFGTIPGAVTAIKKGAYDYLAKPFQKDELLRVIQRVSEKVSLLQENRKLKDEITHRYQYHNLIGNSVSMRKVYQLIERIKDIDATVLITGESGTGKELAAKAIHYSGARKKGPFIAFNCGAIPETLIESELFGHEKGAFTGAQKTYIGKFEQAQGGTIFLDEIGTMRIDLQTRLLRVLQEKKIARIGSNSTIDLDVRVIAATNDDLDDKTSNGGFRVDLYHRLNVFKIELPALRERRSDIPLLAGHFLKKYATLYAKKEPMLSSEALGALEAYAFPGNVRELENIIEKTVILNDGESIEAEKLMMPDTSKPGGAGSFPKKLPELEKTLLIDALQKSEGSLKEAASLLGITYKTLQYRIKKHNINKNLFKHP